MLGEFGVSNVDDLIYSIKLKLKKANEDVSEKAIILRRGNEDLNTETPITGLYNTRDNALHVVVGKHNIQLYLL